MFKKRMWIGIILSIIFLVFSINGSTAYYKYTQESGNNFYVGTDDKADALEDTNEMRQIIDDLGNLLGHSLRNNLYPKDGNTGGYLGRLNYGLFASRPADPVVNDMYLATDTVKIYRCFVAANWVQVYPGEGGVTTFLELTDTPASYGAHGLEILRVNGIQTAVEFSGITIETTLTIDSDAKVPTSKAVNDFCETTKDYMQDLIDDTDPYLGGDCKLNMHNINISASLSSDHTYSGIIDTQTVGESVVFGDLLYFYWTSKKWKKADADTAATMPGLRIALEDKSDNQPCKMLVKGYIRDDSAFEFSGAMVYASVTPGAMSSTAPTEAGDQLQRVGVAKSADILFFDPSIDVGEI
ncbi:hypothetical protein ES705_14589 [subsurface metagenome]